MTNNKTTFIEVRKLAKQKQKQKKTKKNQQNKTNNKATIYRDKTKTQQKSNKKK
jgi:hypothetical protein